MKYYKMKTLILLIVLFFLSCKDKSVNMIERNHFTPKYQIGNNWLYKKRFINPDINTHDSITLAVYDSYKVTKDTNIYGKQFFIIDGKSYEIGKEIARIFQCRMAIHLGVDTITIYAFKNLNAPLFLWKKSAQNKIDEDTSYFSDKYYPLIFPLSDGKSWIIRDAENIFENGEIEMVYLKKDTLDFENNKIQVQKAVLHSLLDVYLWTSEKHGLIKYYVPRVFDTYEIMEFQGYKKFDKKKLEGKELIYID